MRKVVVSVLSLIVLLTASMAQAADRNWTGGGGDDLWTTAANWDTGVPGVGDNGNINNGGKALIDSSVSAELDRVELCNGGSGGATLTMTGGSLKNHGQYPITIGSKPGAGLGIFNLSGGDVFSGDGFLISNSGGSAGIVNMSGGSIDSQATYSPSGWWSIFGVGDAGVGTLNMSGGVITANVMKIPARSGSGTLNMTGGTIEVAGGLYVNGSGEVHLDGGVITADNLSMSDPGTMDITEGTLILEGNDTSVIEGYIASGILTGYGDPANVLYDYNETYRGKTTVWAVPEMAVTNPDPYNGEQRVPLDKILNWGPPDPCNLADPNHPEDVEYIVYFDPNESLVSNGDASVRFGQQSQTQFDPFGAGDMELMTTYYWRVDVVDPNFGEPIIYAGKVCHFSTIAPKAGLVSPENGAVGVAQNVVLQWDAGFGAVEHKVYFGTDQTLVANGDDSVYMGTQEETTFKPDLDWGTEYFWRIDEVFEDGSPEPGDVWSFTTGTPICEYELEGDIDKNCVVNIEDFALMASNWLICNLTNGDCP